MPIRWRLTLFNALAIGAISASVNLANNIRDIPTDAAAGKRTLAVRLGDAKARRLFAALTMTPFVMTFVLAIFSLPTLAALLALPLALASVLKVLRGAQGPALIPVLGLNGKAMLVWTVATAVALVVGGGMWYAPMYYPLV